MLRKNTKSQNINLGWFFFFKSLFDIVILVVFKVFFYLEIYKDDIFLFFKNYF